MRLYHDSRNPEYRTPFGAVTAGTAVRLSLETGECDPEDVRLLLWHGEDAAPDYIQMTRDERGLYTAEIETPEEGGLLWYAFGAETVDGDDGREILYYGNNESNTGGVGSMYNDDPARYQITVYKESPVPEWYTGGIVYQIFPDRFARDGNWMERCSAAVNVQNSRSSGQKRIIQEDWNKKAYYIRDGENNVTEWPIYGGSFEGIREKLDYLKSLGVTCIYLNPVFESVSNHHYDTADFMKTDPCLGTEEELKRLASDAGERGIRIILDGVFNHTGADSVYFDVTGNYEKETGVPGAYLHEESPYRKWFDFDENQPNGYRSWWGVKDLPEVNESDQEYCDFIAGENGVIDHWMKCGISGWRLDVADELPDWFIRDIRSRVKAEDPDGLLIGEVWEDASNKISYGERRRYFMGDELDGTMNYPLRTLLLDYINYTVSAGFAGEELMSLAENYPRANFYAALNLIGSHDRERIITAMAAEENYEAAVSKVRVLSTLQYTLPGVPCIYYGDEVGLTGGPDPENRNGYPWGFENLDLGYHYRMLGLIYDEHPVLKDGDLTMLSGRYGMSDDIFAFMREYRDGSSAEKILVLANRSYGPSDVDLTEVREAGGGYALELLSSDVIGVNENGLDEVIRMEPLSCMIICIRDREPEMEEISRSAGVICHISSLGKGCLGSPAESFADYIASAGMKVWQVLPLNPTGLGGSPYSSFAAFAGNPDFINRDELPDMSGYEEFCSRNSDWLAEYAAYTVIKEICGGKAWQDWPEEYRNADPREAARMLYPEHRGRMDELFMDQYYFHEQWERLKKHANSLGISLMGDLPMYMAADSADVWGNRDVFRLDENGRLKVHAGVPPDAFSGEGQDWGNPLYDWEYLERTGYDWWLRRMRQCAERYDILRIDHFRGLSEYYAIPEGMTPKHGTWQHSAGLRFFEAIKAMLDREELSMKLLAEDLGFLDAGVKNLIKLTGLPGMDIWQFSSDEMMEMKPAKAACRAFYTGTHDNDTLLGYILGQKAGTDERAAEPAAETEEERTAAEIEALKVIRMIYESPAVLAMVQLQDMFMLGSEARMNVPGVAEGNWGWKMEGGSVESSFEDAEERAAWFSELAERTGRA